MGSKLKKTLYEACPECGAPLQVRSRSVSRMEKGVLFYIDEDYIACSNSSCFYEKEVHKQSIRKRYYREK